MRDEPRSSYDCNFAISWQITFSVSRPRLSFVVKCEHANIRIYVYSQVIRHARVSDVSDSQVY